MPEPEYDEKQTVKIMNIKPEAVPQQAMSVHAMFDTMSHKLLEKCVQDDWQSVFAIGKKLTHLSLGCGYFALAVTLKKLCWSLVPNLNVSQARKYILRTIWSLTRAKREQDVRYLIHRHPEQHKINKHDGTATHLVKLHNFDLDAIVPPELEWTSFAPLALQLISRKDDENTVNPESQSTSFCDHVHQPHIKLADTSMIVGQ